MSHLHHKTAQEEKVINSLLKIYDQKSGVFSHKRNFKFVEISNTLSDFLVSSQVMVRPDISCGVIDSSLSIIEYILNFYRYALYSHNSTLTEYETSISAIRWKSRLLTEHLSDINDVPNYSAYLQRINRLDTYINDILNFINSPQTVSLFVYGTINCMEIILLSLCCAFFRLHILRTKTFHSIKLSVQAYNLYVLGSIFFSIQLMKYSNTDFRFHLNK